MGVAYNPKIVTNGLIGYWDAGNPKSYPGSGTTCNDLSGNSVTGTLKNSPTYSSVNGGTFVFAGTGDYIACGTTALPAGNLSAFAWIYPTNVGQTWNIITTKWFNPQLQDFHWAIKNNAINTRQNLYTTSNSDIYATTPISANTWYYVGWTLVNGGTLTWYHNGVADGTSSTVSRTPKTSTLQIGDDRSGFDFIGRIAQVKLYNRALSATEINQNFYAMRGRFKI